MEILRIEHTKDTPTVVLNPETNIFSIEGKSHPENIRAFFTPIFTWLDNYLEEIKAKKNQKIEFNLKYSYVNSSSYKHLTILLQKMEHYIQNGIEVEFIWHFEEEDDDMRESGKELFNLTNSKIPYKIKSFPIDN